MYRVFSQDPSSAPDTDRLAAHASRFFSATVNRVAAGPHWVRVRIASARPAIDAELTIRVRGVTREDLLDAAAAEVRGKAAGMATLAERCVRIWELGPDAGAEAPVAAYVALAGICASVVLGPVLPSDGSTLFGVRGAMDRLALLG